MRLTELYTCIRKYVAYEYVGILESYGPIVFGILMRIERDSHIVMLIPVCFYLEVVSACFECTAVFIGGRFVVGIGVAYVVFSAEFENGNLGFYFNPKLFVQFRKCGLALYILLFGAYEISKLHTVSTRFGVDGTALFVLIERDGSGRKCRYGE